MKKIVVAAIFLASFLQAQTNSMLNGDFWKAKPSIETVKSEISKGNNPAEANRGNHDVTSMAINNNADFEVIKFLIDQPGNAIDKNTHDGRQYLHWASSRGNLALIDYLIQKGSDINRTDDKGATPLVFAASNGQTNPEVFKRFFEAGIDPKQKYTDGANVLLLAIGNDTDLNLTKYLTSKSLSFKDTDAFGRTAFDYAAKNGNIDLLKLLIEKGAKPTNQALIFASQGTRSSANLIEVYQYLIETVKLDPKVKGQNGETVLHNLVRKSNQKDIINYFIAKGVDVNAADKEGNTVLMAAAASKNLDIVELLATKVKDINTANAKGETALFSAVQNGSPEILSYLINKGAKTNVLGKDGNLAFHLVQSYKAPRPNENNNDFENKLQILTKAGVDFNQKLADGSTLLHVAVAKNDLNLIKSLATFNIDVNAQDENGLSVLHKAAMMSHDDAILKYLLSIGAKKDAVTEFEETVYDLASENEYLADNQISIDFLK